MNIYRGLDNLPLFKNAVATMGSFDGLHSGHRELLHRVKTLAAERAGESVVLTFDPHPRYVLGTGEKMQLITTLDEKLWLLEREGIDNVVVIPFTVEFSQMSPKEFLEEISGIGVSCMVVGYNHRFGHKKEGDYNYLEARGGMELHMVEQQQVANSKVSSTIIRQAVSMGMMEKAVRLLAHPYIVSCTIGESGEVVAVGEHKLLPSEGEYEVKICGKASLLKVDRRGKMSICPIVAVGKAVIEIM